MQTYMDAEIVAWIGRLGAAGAGHVMRCFGLSRTVAYRRLGSLACEGLLEHHAVLFGRPGMYSATMVGLRWQSLGRFGVCSVRPGGFEHAWQVAQASVELGHHLPGWGVLSEREVRSVEADEDGLFASVQVGRVGDRQLLHQSADRERLRRIWAVGPRKPQARLRLRDPSQSCTAALHRPSARDHTRQRTAAHDHHDPPPNEAYR